MAALQVTPFTYLAEKDMVIQVGDIMWYNDEPVMIHNLWSTSVYVETIRSEMFHVVFDDLISVEDYDKEEDV